MPFTVEPCPYFRLRPQHTAHCQRDFEVVRDLEPWTTYCVRVQGFLLDQNKSGEWSEPVCEQTSGAGESGCVDVARGSTRAR